MKPAVLLSELESVAEPVQGGYTVGEMKKIAKQKQLNIIFGMAEKKYYGDGVITGHGLVDGLLEKAPVIAKDLLIGDRHGAHLLGEYDFEPDSGLWHHRRATRGPAMSLDEIHQRRY